MVGGNRAGSERVPRRRVDGKSAPRDWRLGTVHVILANPSDSAVGGVQHAHRQRRCSGPRRQRLVCRHSDGRNIGLMSVVQLFQGL